MKRFAVLLCGAIAVSSFAFAQGADDRAGEPPLNLAKQGYFYVGGAKLPRGQAYQPVDQMYVHYQVPAQKKHPYPIIFVHGGSTSGAAYEGTPDDRQGWAEYFLRRGYAVYVVDHPARGRSPYELEVDGPLERAPAGSAERAFTAPAKYNQYPQSRLHNQFPGTGQPGDPDFHRFLSMQHPSINGGIRMDTINRDALVALLDRIGPAIVLTHSRSGPFGWLVADARPKLVKAVLSMEPNGPPFENPPTDSGNAPPSGTNRPWGITYEKMTFSPAVTDPAELKPVLEKPIGPDLLGCWRIGGVKRTLPNLKGIPILIVTSEGGYHAQYDHCTSQFLTDAGVENTYVQLEKKGIRGNGHLMMMEKNNLQIAAMIDEWVQQNVK
jgi:pimeloyl-ACP methyl ester carboxylesterase